MVRKLDVLEFTSGDRHGIKLAIMTEQHVARPQSIPFCAHCAGGLDESSLIPSHRLFARGEPRIAGAVGRTSAGFNDDQRRRLAAKAKALGYRLMKEMTPIVT